MSLVSAEVCRDTDQARAGPVDVPGGLFSQPGSHQLLELRPVIHQPVQVEQQLSHHTVSTATLVLDNHRASVRVEPQRIRPPTVDVPGGVLGGHQPYAENRVHVRLDEPLQIPLDRDPDLAQLNRTTRRPLSEDAQVRHDRHLHPDTAKPAETNQYHSMTPSLTSLPCYACALPRLGGRSKPFMSWQAAQPLTVWSSRGRRRSSRSAQRTLRPAPIPEARHTFSDDQRHTTVVFGFLRPDTGP